jgi:hypothetical protein
MKSLFYQKNRKKPAETFYTLIRILLIITILQVPLYAEKSNRNKISGKKFEIEAGLGYGILNYYVETAANSLLRWRDSSNFQQYAGFKYSATEKINTGLLFENYILSGGEMTDDDLNNLYGSNIGIYSTTRNMKGSGYKVEMNAGYNFFTAGNTDFIGTAGIFIRKYEIKPEGVLQVAVIPGETPDNWVYYDDENTQHTKITYKGFQIGAEAVHRTSYSSVFTFAFKLVLPVIHDSKQYYWGYGAPDYDWKLEQNSIFKTGGIDLKIENRFRINDRIWWGIYAYYSRMVSTEQDEIDWDGTSSYTKVGTARNSILTMAGAGLSLYF